MSILSFRGEISRLQYCAAAILLILSQNGAVALAYALSGAELAADGAFWLLPLRRLIEMPGLTPGLAGLLFIYSLAVGWVLAVLSFRRASASGRGYLWSASSIVPGLQLLVILLLAVQPERRAEEDREMESAADAAHILQGILAGVAIIVAALLLSALTFGAYGWGLFLMTPLMVGISTGYIANRRVLLDSGKTTGLVLIAACLGTLSLIVLALEGIVCVILAAPLGLAAAAAGGLIGRALAKPGLRRGRPFLATALLPAIFALEAALPPAVTISADQSIDIAASPEAVWRALTSDEPIRTGPGLVGRAGLAYPIQGRLLGQGIGARRIGLFSTGRADERITVWAPQRRLAFDVVSQPPSMEEMSPYRRVHAPHVSGYFVTRQTEFRLDPLAEGGTRLRIAGLHVLRIDPAPYWEPIARWAIRANVSRVLADIKDKAEAPDPVAGLSSHV